MSTLTWSESVLEDGDIEFVVTDPATGEQGWGFTRSGAYKNLLRKQAGKARSAR